MVSARTINGLLISCCETEVDSRHVKCLCLWTCKLDISKRKKMDYFRKILTGPQTDQVPSGAETVCSKHAMSF